MHKIQDERSTQELGLLSLLAHGAVRSHRAADRAEIVAVCLAASFFFLLFSFFFFFSFFLCLGAREKLEDAARATSKKRLRQ